MLFTMFLIIYQKKKCYLLCGSIISVYNFSAKNRKMHSNNVFINNLSFYKKIINWQNGLSLVIFYDNNNNNNVCSRVLSLIN